MSVPKCPRYDCGGSMVVRRIMAWCDRCKWTTYADRYLEVQNA